MAKRKSIVKFILNNQNLAIVEETETVEDLSVTNHVIGTGGGGNVTFTGTLLPVVEEGSLVLKVNSVDQGISDYPLSTSTGRSLFTSSGMGTVTEGGFLTSIGLVTSTGYGMLGGATLTTSSGAVNIINYESGDIRFSFSSAPTAGHKITISYERTYIPSDYTSMRIIEGDFSNYSVGSTVYYEYDDSGDTAYTITVKRPGE